MKLNPNQRYWISMLTIAVLTLLAAGIVGGIAAKIFGETSLWAGIVIVLIFLVGWRVSYRVRERKKLGYPLWRRLSEKQAQELAQYRDYSRSGRITKPSAQAIAKASKPTLSPQNLSAKDRARIADVTRQHEARLDAAKPKAQK